MCKVLVPSLCCSQHVFVTPSLCCSHRFCVAVSKRFTPYVSLALGDATPLPSSTTNTLQTSLGPPGTPKPTFAQTLTFPATTLTTENTTLTCSLMSSLRFGADATVSTCTIPITSAILKAGRKGTLFNWYKLDSPSTDNADALPVAGEVSLSFRFKPFNPPSPVRTKPIALERPWYLTLEGLYMGGKGAWQSALSSDRCVESTNACARSEQSDEGVERK